MRVEFIMQRVFLFEESGPPRSAAAAPWPNEGQKGAKALERRGGGGGACVFLGCAWNSAFFFLLLLSFILLFGCLLFTFLFFWKSMMEKRGE